MGCGHPTTLNRCRPTQLTIAAVQAEYGDSDCNTRDTGHSIESLPLVAMAEHRVVIVSLT